MKKLLLFCLALFGISGQAQSVTVFDEILFYDGYAALVDLATHPVPDGVIRHRNDCYAKKLTSEQLAAFGSSLTMNVTIKAACDNYDRIGNVNLAFVPIGSTTYNPSEVQHIELGRFITPFMNKNLLPDEVPYTFSIDNVSKIFQDPAILAAYDIWIELEVFGVPYAAQTQVAGCAGRIDVFYGTLEFVGSGAPSPDPYNFLLPLDFKHNLNNYEVGATDAIGTTARTIVFNVPQNLSDAKFHVITSNHGANAGGEEYNRRNHHIYLDGVHVIIYKPGGVSCEPYRVYNTQGNGIYGPTPRTDAEWASFSNWCPGQIIPIRSLSLGDLSAGEHIFKITVPTAVFVGQQGYIPVSVYLQGTTANLATKGFTSLDYSLYPNPTNDVVKIQSSSAVQNFELYNMIGQKVAGGASDTVDLSQLQKGVYLLQIAFDGHKTITEKIIRN